MKLKELIKINCDKIQLSVQTKEPFYNIETQLNNNNFDTELFSDFNNIGYEFNIKISKGDRNLGELNFNHRLSHLSVLKLNKKTLYQKNKSTLKKLVSVIYKIFDSVKISKLELCCDTNINVIENIQSGFNNEILELNGFDVSEYKTIYQNNRKTDGVKTFYISKNKMFNNEKRLNKKARQKPFVRVENKSDVIKDTGDKYILHNLSDTLDMTKDVYRIELVYDCVNSLMIKKNNYFSDKNHSSFFTEKTIQKYQSEIDNSDNLFNSKALEILSRYTKKVSRTRYLHFDLNKIDDQEYLMKFYFNNLCKVFDIRSLDYIFDPTTSTISDYIRDSEYSDDEVVLTTEIKEKKKIDIIEYKGDSDLMYRLDIIQRKYSKEKNNEMTDEN
jgi:hypothetical protein